MLLPHELKKDDFTKSFKGYTTTEVDDYIDFLIEKYTEVHRENDELERKLKSAVARIDELLKKENQLKDTLLNVRQAGDQIIDEANERADLIVRSAMDRCNAVLAEFGSRVRKSQETLSAITAEIEAFKTSLYVRYNDHIEQIEHLTDFSEYRKPISHYSSRIVDGIKLDLEESLLKEFEEARRREKKKAAMAKEAAAEAAMAEEIEAPAEDDFETEIADDAVYADEEFESAETESYGDEPVTDDDDTIIYPEDTTPADEITVGEDDAYSAGSITADTALTDIPEIIDYDDDDDSYGGTPDGEFIPDDGDSVYDEPIAEEVIAADMITDTISDAMSAEDAVISEERAFNESARASLFAKKPAEKPREDPLSLTDEFELVYSNNEIDDETESEIE